MLRRPVHTEIPSIRPHSLNLGDIIHNVACLIRQGLLPVPARQRSDTQESYVWRVLKEFTSNINTFLPGLSTHLEVLGALEISDELDSEDVKTVKALNQETILMNVYPYCGADVFDGSHMYKALEGLNYLGRHPGCEMVHLTLAVAIHEYLSEVSSFIPILGPGMLSNMAANYLYPEDPDEQLYHVSESFCYDWRSQHGDAPAPELSQKELWTYAEENEIECTYTMNKRLGLPFQGEALTQYYRHRVSWDELVRSFRAQRHMLSREHQRATATLLRLLKTHSALHQLWNDAEKPLHIELCQRRVYGMEHVPLCLDLGPSVDANGYRVTPYMSQRYAELVQQDMENGEFELPLVHIPLTDDITPDQLITLFALMGELHHSSMNILYFIEIEYDKHQPPTDLIPPQWPWRLPPESQILPTRSLTPAK